MQKRAGMDKKHALWGRLTDWERSLVYMYFMDVEFSFYYLFRKYDRMVRMGNMAVPSLTKMLYSEDNIERHNACVLLTKMGETAVPTLQKALEGKDVKASRYAAIALGKMGDGRCIPVLIGAMADKDPEMRKNATDMLERLAKKDPSNPALLDAIPLLITTLGDGQEELRLDAKLALQWIGRPAIPFLAKELERGENAEARRSSARLLERFARFHPDDPELAKVIPSLIKALADEDEAVRSEAQTALEWIGENATFSLTWVLGNHKDCRLRAKSAQALEEIADIEALPYLVAALKDADGKVRENSVAALVAIAKANPNDKRLKNAIPPLVERLCDPEKDVGISAGIALCVLGRQALPELETVRDSNDRYLSEHAGVLIDEIFSEDSERSDPRIIKPFEEYLSNDHEEVRLFAMGNLARMAKIYGKDKEMLRLVPAFVVMLNERNSTIRVHAANAIGSLAAYIPGDPGILSSVPLLTGMLKNEAITERIAAVESLWNIADANQGRPELRPAIPVLADGLVEPDDRLRLMSARSLAMILKRNSEHPEALTVASRVMEALDDRIWGVRFCAAFSIGLILEEHPGKLDKVKAVKKLIEMLKDENEKVRMPAAESLGRIGDPVAIPELIEAVKSGNVFAQEGATFALRIFAEQGIGDAELRRAVEPLIAASQCNGGEGRELESAETRQNAIDALVWIKDPRAVPALFDAIMDEDKNVRLNAMAGLDAMGPGAAEYLAISLDYDDVEIRRHAAITMAAITEFATGDGRCLSLVLPMVTALLDEDRHVRRFLIRGVYGALENCASAGTLDDFERRLWRGFDCLGRKYRNTKEMPRAVSMFRKFLDKATDKRSHMEREGSFPDGGPKPSGGRRGKRTVRNG